MPVQLEDLIAADDPVRAEDPGPERFCRRDAISWFTTLVRIIKERFPEISHRTGLSIQDASFHSELAIRKGDRAALLRFSNFGYFAAIWDKDQCLSAQERQLVERILAMQGDRLVDADLLEREYTGRNPGVSGFRTWRERYFEFIPAGSGQSLLDLLAAKRANPAGEAGSPGAPPAVPTPLFDPRKNLTRAKQELGSWQCPYCLLRLQDAPVTGEPRMSRFWCGRCGFEITTSLMHPTHVYLALLDTEDEVRLAAARDRYGARAQSCKCGKKADELRWFYFSTPAATWAHLAGRAGWMTYCETCKREVDFFLTRMN
jgi:hypothetical protein